MGSCYPIGRSTPISREKQGSTSRAKSPSDREKSQKTTFLQEKIGHKSGNIPGKCSGRTMNTLPMDFKTAVDQ